MRYKNISQRAKRYARGKAQRVISRVSFNSDTMLAIDQANLTRGFADGYRLAMKELRQFIESNTGDNYRGGDKFVSNLEDFVNDTERLK